MWGISYNSLHYMEAIFLIFIYIDFYIDLFFAKSNEN